MLWGFCNERTLEEGLSHCKKIKIIEAHTPEGGRGRACIPDKKSEDAGATVFSQKKAFKS
jgi:hypothetical protein